MITLAKRRLLCIWIALLAMVFSAFAPAVSHALAAQSSAYDMLELCTMRGIQFVQWPRSEGDPGQSSMHGIAHCALCSSHGASHVLPARLHGILLARGGHDHYPPLYYRAPRPVHAWPVATPRGPPASA